MKDKKNYKEEYVKFERQNQSEIENLNKELDSNIKDLDKSLNLERITLIQNYER